MVILFRIKNNPYTPIFSLVGVCVGENINPQNSLFSTNGNFDSGFLAVFGFPFRVLAYEAENWCAGVIFDSKHDGHNIFPNSKILVFQESDLRPTIQVEIHRVIVSVLVKSDVGLKMMGTIKIFHKNEISLINYYFGILRF